MQEPPINFGLLLFIPYRHMESRILQAIKDAGFDDVTLAQARVFQRIAPGGSRLTDLAEQAQMTKQSAAGLVDELERMGYVRRVPDPSDRRARLIQIDKRGLQAGKAAQEAHDAIAAEWRSHLGIRRFGQLREALEDLRAITDPFA
ncbi:MarR family transcriptional regulator [Mycobacterium sp. OAE908]|uniref:MarR family winged helix-turn-helix transcriptional regulator n=1 Tax=Mycobacterium sp. OAE908 TaxID=2817899 RepID=UPI001AE9157A